MFSSHNLPMCSEGLTVLSFCWSISIPLPIIDSTIHLTDWLLVILIMTESLTLTERTFLWKRNVKICTIVYKQAVLLQQPSRLLNAHALLGLIQWQESMSYCSLYGQAVTISFSVPYKAKLDSASYMLISAVRVIILCCLHHLSVVEYLTTLWILRFCYFLNKPVSSCAVAQLLAHTFDSNQWRQFVERSTDVWKRCLIK